MRVVTRQPATFTEAALILTRRGAVSFQLHYDVGYGVLGRSGWSVIVDGRVIVQFLPSAEEAMREALKLATCSVCGATPDEPCDAGLHG